MLELACLDVEPYAGSGAAEPNDCFGGSERLSSGLRDISSSVSGPAGSLPFAEDRIHDATAAPMTVRPRPMTPVARVMNVRKR